MGRVVPRHKLIKQPSALILVMSELSLDNRCIASYFTIIACIRRILMLIRPEIVNVANIGQQIMAGIRTSVIWLASPIHISLQGVGSIAPVNEQSTHPIVNARITIKSIRFYIIENRRFYIVN